MQKNVRVFVIGAVLITAILFGVYWMQHYLLRSRASAAPPTASLIITGPKVNPGDSFDVTVQINPNLTPFYSFDVAFTYDPLKVDLQITDPAKLVENITPLSSKGNADIDVQLLKGAGTTNINTASNTVRISGLKIDGSSDPFTGRDPLNIVKVLFVMKAGQSLPLDFKWVDPDSTKVNDSDSYEKKDLHYTGEEPTPTPVPTDIPAVSVPTSTPIPGAVQPTGAFNSLTPFPTIEGGSGQTGQTTTYTPRADLLYINSIASYQSPFRYEQGVKLEKGSYTLKVGAKVYVNKGRGLVIGLICNQTTCGAKKMGQTLSVSKVFPMKAEFSEMIDTITIPEAADNKAFILRVFCEDGSECELDYITLEDAWGTERLKNNNFEDVQKLTDPRRQPSSWEVDATANLYGSIDPATGIHGALMINNSAK